MDHNSLLRAWLLAIIALLSGLWVFVLFGWPSSCGTDYAACSENSSSTSEGQSPPTYGEELPQR
jgi:hypothetical protein